MGLYTHCNITNNHNTPVTSMFIVSHIKYFDIFYVCILVWFSMTSRGHRWLSCRLHFRRSTFDHAKSQMLRVAADTRLQWTNSTLWTVTKLLEFVSLIHREIRFDRPVTAIDSCSRLVALTLISRGTTLITSVQHWCSEADWVKIWVEATLFRLILRYLFISPDKT